MSLILDTLTIQRDSLKEVEVVVEVGAQEVAEEVAVGVVVEAAQRGQLPQEELSHLTNIGILVQ